MNDLDDLLYDSDALLSPESTAAAGPPADAAARDAAFVASHCGACFEEERSFAHVCKLKAVDPAHVVPLHAKLLCERVVMPIEGYYFCDMTCLHGYNSFLEMNHDAFEVMPDGGVPHGRSELEFLLPARRAPGAPVELAPWEQPVVHETGTEAEAEAEAAEAAEAEAAEATLAIMHTRVVIGGAPGIVVVVRATDIAVVFDDRSWDVFNPDDFASKATAEPSMDRSTAVADVLWDRVPDGQPHAGTHLPCAFLLRATCINMWTLYEVFEPAEPGPTFTSPSVCEKLEIGASVTVPTGTALVQTVVELGTLYSASLLRSCVRCDPRSCLFVCAARLNFRLRSSSAASSLAARMARRSCVSCCAWAPASFWQSLRRYP